MAPADTTWSFVPSSLRRVLRADMRPSGGAASLSHDNVASLPAGAAPTSFRPLWHRVHKRLLCLTVDGKWGFGDLSRYPKRAGWLFVHACPPLTSGQVAMAEPLCPEVTWEVRALRGWNGATLECWNTRARARARCIEVVEVSSNVACTQMSEWKYWRNKNVIDT